MKTVGLCCMQNLFDHLVALCKNCWVLTQSYIRKKKKYHLSMQNKTGLIPRNYNDQSSIFTVFYEETLKCVQLFSSVVKTLKV